MMINSELLSHKGSTFLSKRKDLIFLKLETGSKLQPGKNV